MEVTKFASAFGLKACLGEEPQGIWREFQIMEHQMGRSQVTMVMGQYVTKGRLLQRVNYGLLLSSQYHLLLHLS